jgi:hypothetical protein
LRAKLNRLVLGVLESHDGVCLDEEHERNRVGRALTDALYRVLNDPRPRGAHPGPVKPAESLEELPMIKIRLLRLGHSATTHEIDEGATPQDVLDGVGVEVHGHSVTVNGIGADLSASLRDGDIVTLSPKVMGGQ